jgi:hypothetical protein
MWTLRIVRGIEKASVSEQTFSTKAEMLRAVSALPSVAYRRRLGLTYIVHAGQRP